jgi:hypothetical protein
MPDDAAWRRQLSQDSKQTAVKKKMKDMELQLLRPADA